MAVVILDTESDQVEIVTGSQCNYVRDGILSDDGYIYMATEAWGSAMHYVNDEVTAPCMLRFDPEREEFDDDFHVELNTLLDADSVGSLIVGPGNTPFILALDAEDYEGPKAGRPLASAPLWAWASLTLGDEPSAEMLDDSLTAGGSQLPVHFDDESYLPLLDDETVFVAFDEDGPSAEGASIPGLAFSAVRLQK